MMTSPLQKSSQVRNFRLVRMAFSKRFLRRTQLSIARQAVTASAQSQGPISMEFPSGQPPAAASITLVPWSPGAGYLERIRRAPAPERFAVYLEMRSDHALQPGFFLDIAGYFLDEAKDSAAGLQILSNLAEFSLEDAPMLRVADHRLVQAGRADLALPVFERVLKLRA